MNRRNFLLTAGVLALPKARAAGQSVRLTVRPDLPLQTISPDFMGLGYEIASVARPGLLSGSNTAYAQFVRTLGARGVIRIGGNTADFAKYSPSAAPVSSPFGTVVNQAVLNDLGSFLKATGWRLIWALDLGKGTEAEAIDEARAIIAIVGDKLLGFEIGNEPDLFGRAKHRQPEYAYEDWLAEYRRYKAALRAQFPRIPFAGPDVAGKTDWVTRFAADEGKDCVLLTHHYYREGQNPASTIEKLLAPDPKLQPQLDELSRASTTSGIPYRICEVNSFSGGGRPGVSDTMAAALWALDYMFTLAAGGCAGVNMETGVHHRDFLSSYSPIGDDEHGRYSAKPEYYGMLAFSLAARGRMLTVEMNPGLPEMKAYATQPRQGSLAVTLINKGSAPIDIECHAPGRRASAVRLTGPSIDSKTGVTLGGAEVDAAGVWKPRPEVLRVRNGEFSLTLPAFSAAIVSNYRGRVG